MKMPVVLFLSVCLLGTVARAEPALRWHTDLDEALAEARQLGRPVPSLRLLGKLTEEEACANSRFFKRVLYPNGEVKAMLSAHFILHWESVAPVPIVTIDFGNGTVLRRPFSGNSAHMVLDANGRLLDAIPGLYEQTLFLDALRPALAICEAK